MNGRRAKLTAGATVLGLGALGGAALGTNPGIPTVAQQAAPGAEEQIVTGASGSATAVTRPVALRTGSSTRPPIVTHASGGPRPGSEVDD
jgi:hypothetical protein